VDVIRRRDVDRSLAQIERALAQVPSVGAVGVFGSVARGKAGPLSDLDLLVLSTDSSLRPSRLLASIPLNTFPRSVSIQCYTPERLDKTLASGSTFSKHLVREMRVLFDRTGRLESMLRESADSPVQIDEELGRALLELRRLRDLSRFRGNYLSVLARLYVIGRALVIVDLVGRHGRYDFSADSAFETFASHHRDLSAEASAIQQLRPFSLLISGREGPPLPFDYRCSLETVNDVRDAVERLASTLE
jgi:hypothetical protein